MSIDKTLHDYKNHSHKVLNVATYEKDENDKEGRYMIEIYYDHE